MRQCKINNITINFSNSFHCHVWFDNGRDLGEPDWFTQNGAPVWNNRKGVTLNLFYFQDGWGAYLETVPDRIQEPLGFFGLFDEEIEEWTFEAVHQYDEGEELTFIVLMKKGGDNYIPLVQICKEYLDTGEWRWYYNE